MLQFLIGLSIFAFALVIIYGTERIIFHRNPKAAAVHTIDASTFDVYGGLLFGILLLLMLVIVVVPILCLYAFQRIVFGQKRACDMSAATFLLRASSALVAAFGPPYQRISRIRKDK